MRTLPLAAALLALSAPAPGDDPRPAPAVVGHRGLLRHAPENTLAAFAACLELNLGFELDVRRSAEIGRASCRERV